jgi:phosphate/sulfate permease
MKRFLEDRRKWSEQHPASASVRVATGMVVVGAVMAWVMSKGDWEFVLISVPVSFLISFLIAYIGIRRQRFSRLSESRDSKFAFRGSIELHALASTWPFSAARLTILRDRLEIKPFLRSLRVVKREDLNLLLAKRIRVPPFAWRTVIDIQYSSASTRHRIRFIPFKETQTIKALEKLEWPTQ